MNLKELSKEFNYLNEQSYLGVDGKIIDPNSVEMKGIEYDMGVDDGTSGARVRAAKFTDGKKLSDEQLKKFNRSSDPKIVDFIQSKAEEEYESKKYDRMREGTCGYSVDGKPASKPAGPHLIRKAIREEIKKLSEMDDGINPKVKSIASNINKAIISIDPDMPYMDFAKGVAQVLIDEYGTHNYEPFIKELKNALDSTLGE